MSTLQNYNAGVAELGRKNQAGGYVGIDDNGVVLGTFAQRVDTAANLELITLAAGELGYASDTKELLIGDGATAGGIFHSQVPIVQSKSVSDGLSAVTISTTENTIYIPRKLGATYRISGAARFSGDSGNESNFKLRLYFNNTLSGFIGLLSPLINAAWFDEFGVPLENKAIPISLIGALSPFGVDIVMDSPNLTRSGAILVFATQVSPIVGTNLQPFFAVRPIVRTGSSSPATADLNVTHQRIA